MVYDLVALFLDAGAMWSSESELFYTGTRLSGAISIPSLFCDGPEKNTSSCAHGDLFFLASCQHTFDAGASCIRKSDCQN